MAFQRKKPAAVGIETLYPGFIDPALPTSIEKARQSDIARQRNALQVVRDVQIRLVQRQRLDDRRVFRKNLADLLRDALQTSKRGFTKIRSGHCRLAVTAGIADWTPTFLAS
jgi:hypothetical protein